MAHAPRIAFFGTPEFAVTILNRLHASGIVPDLIVTAKDKPQGRGLVLTPSPVKVWAREHNITHIEPETLKGDIPSALSETPFDIYVVAAYGLIIPESILTLPKKGALNVHPSLLPRFRGPSPIESQILTDEKTVGVSIMLLDSEVDHGPVLAQEVIPLSSWPPKRSELEHLLAEKGGDLLARTIPQYLSGEIESKEQDHRAATFTKKIRKEDGLITQTEDPYQTFLKINAYEEWPGTFFFAEKNGKTVRVKVTEAHYENGALTITSVIPEGKREMSYHDFLQGGYILAAKTTEE